MNKKWSIEYDKKNKNRIIVYDDEMGYEFRYCHIKDKYKLNEFNMFPKDAKSIKEFIKNNRTDFFI